jgi:hypothetical protein
MGRCGKGPSDRALDDALRTTAKRIEKLERAFDKTGITVSESSKRMRRSLRTPASGETVRIDEVLEAYL